MHPSVADAFGRCRRDILQFVCSGDRRMIVEAAAALVLVRIGLWTLPFATVSRLAEGRERRERRTTGDEASRLGSIVLGVARRIPLMTCLVQALAAQAMLRRRGYESTVRHGVKSGGNGRALDAHAWLVCGGSVVVGEAEMSDYATLEGAGSR